MEIVDRIIQGDNVQVLRQIPDCAFDFCFADPPYFMQIQDNKKLYRAGGGGEFDGCDDDWDKFESMDAYKDWTRRWLAEVRRTLKEDGAICLISSMQSIYEIGNIMRELGFWVINDIIWQKSNPTPNFRGTRLNNSHETLIWAAKSKTSKYTFNYKTGKFLNNGKQMGSIWTFPVCSGNERLKDEHGHKVHTTQKPEALLYRVMALFTKKDDLVLDPFGGTMTTGALAKLMGRHYTMIELDANYIKYGEKRLVAVEPRVGDVEDAVFDIKPPKVTIREMIDDGFLNIGELFYHKNGQSAPLADKDGKLIFEGKTYSMHEVAADMMGASRRVNAFEFLYVRRDEQLVSLYDIREKYRRQVKNKAEQ